MKQAEASEYNKILMFMLCGWKFILSKNWNSKKIRI